MLVPPKRWKSFSSSRVIVCQNCLAITSYASPRYHFRSSCLLAPVLAHHLYIEMAFQSSKPLPGAIGGG